MKIFGKRSFYRCALSVALTGVFAGSSMAGSVFSTDLTFVFDDETLAEVAEQSLILPDVSGQVVYEVDPSIVDSGASSTVDPTGGLISLLVEISLPGSGVVGSLNETQDVDFPEFPEVDLVGSRVTGIDYEVDIGVATGSIVGDEFMGDAELFVIEGSGSVLFSDPVLISAGDVDSDDVSDPNVIPTPSAAAGGLVLLGMISARRRRSA
ncbi:MAG: hypothetical protein AAGG38_04355 [Planctomycetota bacterium]